ncbi:unnamed protein product [Lepeophtheirus salmonis]|uniref:(salmon louse) hypothetical protein n=1 Tax=Lepeophtheirus salmonis TaxID=72036 RepID=A0A7R8D6U9_LEPSM|nr:unnamed protein product [Lepeophtheirus salmonis]CAF2993427.1 unnamed protein product [Lepeophtheirus salmonis]
MEKDIVIYQQEGSSGVGKETGDYPIRETPTVEVGTVAKEKSPEAKQLKSLAEKKKTAYTPEDFSLREDLWLVQNLEFLLWKESHDALELTQQTKSLVHHGPCEEVNKLNSLLKADLSKEKWSQGAEGIKKVGILLRDFLYVLIESSYHDMDLKFLLSKDSVKTILEVAKVERPINNGIKWIKFQKENFQKMNHRP